jgi:hypothetical protein
MDKIDIFMSDLVLCSFVVRLDTQGAHGDFWGEDGLVPVHQKKGVSPVAQLGDVQLPHSAHGSSSIHFLPCFFSVSLETLENFCIDSFHLTVALWMSNRRIAYLDT